MGWAEIIKAVNSNISVPLDKLITSMKDSLNTAVTNAKDGVDASITSVKDEISTLIKKNGASYPNVITGTIAPGEKIEVSGKGKITTITLLGSGITSSCKIDGKSLTGNSFATSCAESRTLTFEKSLYLKNATKGSDSDYSIAYLLQLIE